MRISINAASDADNNSLEDVLDDATKQLSDDFNYILDGLDILSNMNRDSAQTAVSIAKDIKSSLARYIANIGSELADSSDN